MCTIKNARSAFVCAVTANCSRSRNYLLRPQCQHRTRTAARWRTPRRTQRSWPRRTPLTCTALRRIAARIHMTGVDAAVVAVGEHVPALIPAAYIELRRRLACRRRRRAQRPCPLIATAPCPPLLQQKPAARPPVHGLGPINCRRTYVARGAPPHRLTTTTTPRERAGRAAVPSRAKRLSSAR